jgi:hypothetical protein
MSALQRDALSRLLPEEKTRQTDLENRTRKVMADLRLLRRLKLSAREKKEVARLEKETEEILLDIEETRKALRFADGLVKRSQGRANR